MTRDELEEIIANGENSRIEFKRDDIRAEQLAKEVVALANFRGGKVLLGVEDTGEISGVSRDNLEEWVMNVFQNNIHPMILPAYETVRVADKQIAIIDFPQGISKPYAVKHNGRETIYIRMGSTSRIATREQLARLFQMGGMLHTETMPVPQTGLHSLDEARLLNYIRDILQDPEVPSNPSAWQQRLLGLGFLAQVDNNIYATIAGLVLFGKHPRKYFKQAGLRLMSFADVDKTYSAQLDVLLDGPIVGRWEVSDNGRELIEQGLIEQCIARLQPFIQADGAVVDDYLRRDRAWLYPLEALRESILNALAHRDWTRFIEIDIVNYSDRLEIISPGYLPNSMTIEKMKLGQRSPRNTIIMEVLRDYGYVDARGMGVRTKIVPLVKAWTGREPVFELTEDYLKTILYRLP